MLHNRLVEIEILNLNPLFIFNNPCLITNFQFHHIQSTYGDIPSYLPSTTVAKTLHDRINLLLKDLSQLGAVLVNSGCFTVI